MVMDKSSREMQKVLLVSRYMMDLVTRTDATEAEFRQLIERVFQTLMGYDAGHISREYRLHGTGDPDYCDFAIQVEHGTKLAPAIIVEVEKENLELAEKRLQQQAAGAVNIGCEWAILTNGREWRIYHIPFSQPPETVLLDSWNLMADDLAVLVSKFEMISYRNVRRSSLEQLRLKSNALKPQNLLRTILSPASIDLLRKQLGKKSHTALYPGEVMDGIKRLLNESALAEMENIKASLEDKGKTFARKKTAAAAAEKTPDSPVISYNTKPQ